MAAYMIALTYNFAHAFEGKVLLRKIDRGLVPIAHLLFDSKGLHDFEIPLDIQEDGRYQVTLDWEYEGRNFFHQSDYPHQFGQTGGGTSLNVSNLWIKLRAWEKDRSAIGPPLQDHIQI